jgi:hypothetical protein
MANPDAPTFSLVGGGLLQRLTQRLDIDRGEKHHVRRMALLFVGVTWLPLMAMALPVLVATGRLPPLLADISLHARLLLAGPIFYLAEASLHMRTARCIDRFVGEQFTDDQNGFERILAWARRWRDAIAPELVLLILAIVGGQLLLWGVDESLGLGRGRHVEGRRSPLTLWYYLVALPAYQFLGYRWLWRWLIWSGLLWRLSRLRLRPMSTHPDHHGGMGFLAEPAVGFGLVVLGESIVQAAIWENHVVFAHVDVLSLKSLLALFLLLNMVLTFGPLVPFAFPLARARFAAVRQYDHLALDYTRLFHARWIEQGEREGLLGAPDIQSLADMGNSYDFIRKMRILPFGPRELAIVGAAVLAPMLPLAMLQIPLIELIQKLGHVAMGGLPG